MNIMKTSPHVDKHFATERVCTSIGKGKQAKCHRAAVDVAADNEYNFCFHVHLSALVVRLLLGICFNEIFKLSSWSIPEDSSM